MSGPRFPVLGEVINPTASDYRLEAFLLRGEARAQYRVYRAEGGGSRGGRHFTTLYELARRFERTARRKDWALSNRGENGSEQQHGGASAAARDDGGRAPRRARL